MSEFRIDQITNQAGSRGPDIAGITTFSGVSGMVMPSGPTEYRGGRGRGLFAGGQPGTTNTIEYVTIATTGNAINFGDLTVGRQTGLGGASSSTRGVFMSGFDPSSALNVIDYVTISSTGNAFDFGDLRHVSFNGMRLSNNIRGLHAGFATPTYLSDIDVITIATKGNANKFGDLTAPAQGGGATSSSTRGVIALGRSPAGANDTNTLEYVTIMSNGNSQDFGDLSILIYSCAAVSNGIRGVFSGNNNGAAPQAEIIDYITIASTGNAQDFGNLSRATSATSSNNSMAATSNSIRGLFAGGYLNAPTIVNNIDYITIATTGNSADFGDLLTARRTFDGCSDAHGGLGD
jgi:hypothetical protein